MAQKITLAQRVRDLWLAGYSITEISGLKEFRGLAHADVHAACHAHEQVSTVYHGYVVFAGILTPHKLDIRA